MSGWESFGDRARIVGFEPEPIEAKALIERYSDDPCVDIVAAALGESDGTMGLVVTEDASGSSFHAPAGLHRYGGEVIGRNALTEVEVEVRSLDSWARDDGGTRCHAMKLDTQGAELAILRGADRVLDDVRILVAELHLNEMYEGAPLFAEVDTFLRTKGFELWGFPVIASYQAMDSRSRRIVDLDIHWSGDVPVPVPVADAQIFWADALYVKRDFALAEEATLGSLITDAALAVGMARFGLARRALDAAIRLASGSVLDSLVEARACLADCGHMRAFEHSRHERLRTDAIELDRPHEVDLGDHLQGWGWREPTMVDGRSVRWTGPQSEAAIDLPLVLRPGATIEISILTAASPSLLEGLVLEVDGSVVESALEAGSQGLVLRGTVTGRWERGFTRVLVRTGRPIAWREVTAESDDWSEHGIAVNGITIRP